MWTNENNTNGIENVCKRSSFSPNSALQTLWNVIIHIRGEYCARKETTEPICLFIYYYSFILNPQTIDRSFSASYSDALKLFVLWFCERVVVVVVIVFFSSLYPLHLFPSFTFVSVLKRKLLFYSIRMSEWVCVCGIVIIIILKLSFSPMFPSLFPSYLPKKLKINKSKRCSNSNINIVNLNSQQQRKIE